MAIEDLSGADSDEEANEKVKSLITMIRYKKRNKRENYRINRTIK